MYANRERKVNTINNITYGVGRFATSLLEISQLFDDFFHECFAKSHLKGIENCLHPMDVFVTK